MPTPWQKKNKAYLRAYKKRRYDNDPAVRERIKAAYHKHKAANPRYNVQRWLRVRYGLTLEDYDALFKKQGRRCPGCGADTPGGRGWNVHHSHKSDKVLAILCNLCNRGSGLLADDPVRLRRLADINEE